MRSYWRRRCRSCASTISSRRAGSCSSCVAAPGGDELQFVFVIFARQPLRHAADAGAPARTARAPSRRSVSCDAGRRSLQTAAANSSPAAAVRSRQPCAQGSAAVLARVRVERCQCFEQQFAFGRTRRARRADAGSASRAAVRTDASNARASAVPPASRRNSRSSAHSAPGGSSRSGCGAAAHAAPARVRRIA